MDQIRIVFQFLVEVEIGIRNIKAEVLWAVAGVQCGCAPLQAQCWSREDELRLRFLLTTVVDF